MDSFNRFGSSFSWKEFRHLKFAKTDPMIDEVIGDFQNHKSNGGNNDLVTRFIRHCSYNCVQSNPGKSDECVAVCLEEAAGTMLESVLENQ